MLQNLRIGLRKRRNGKSDGPVKQRGGWPKSVLNLKEQERATTEAWSPWAEGGVVRREGDEIRLVAVLAQVVFRSKTVRRAVLEVTECLDHVPNVS